jgi:hypothetical protein
MTNMLRQFLNVRLNTFQLNEDLYYFTNLKHSLNSAKDKMEVFIYLFFTF